MHEPCQNQTSHYSRENRYFYLSVVPWSRTKFYKLQVQKEKPTMFTYVAPPHGWPGTPLKGECVLCCIFTYKWDGS